MAANRDESSDYKLLQTVSGLSSALKRANKPRQKVVNSSDSRHLRAKIGRLHTHVDFSKERHCRLHVELRHAHNTLQFIKRKFSVLAY